MDHTLNPILLILVVAILVAIAARRLRLPYTVGLVVVGSLIAVLRTPRIALTHDLVFDILLPPLLFEASLMIPWPRLRADLLPVLVLSTLGTLIAAAVTAAGMVALLHWSPQSALLFGVLIAATDPVAVIALFKDQGVEGRLRLLVESESLFNDGVAAVLFVVALDIAIGHGLAGPELAATLAETVLGGMAIGAGIAGIVILLAGRTTDHLVEAALTVVAAWGSFALAEHLHVSGVLATVMAGLVLGNTGILRQGDGAVSEEGRAFVVEAWDFAAFLANSIIFPLIGMSLAGIAFAGIGLPALAVAVLIVLASRAVTVYPLALAFRWSRWAIPAREQHVLWWGGLRGALALALVLALPPDLPDRDAIVAAAFGVVAFSIVVQGLTMPAFLRILGINRVS